ncbi:MAG: type II toxin-antitoxin system VapC family toxin [Symploca sp. SIO2G7]|nr:type II toxin-antitoxin system VapC family toxin [Symploca sp. SIO2G7]
MNRFVLDCSVVFGFSFEDEDTKYVMKVAEALRTGEAMVPQFLPQKLPMF